MWLPVRLFVPLSLCLSVCQCEKLFAFWCEFCWPEWMDHRVLVWWSLIDCLHVVLSRLPLQLMRMLSSLHCPAGYSTDTDAFQSPSPSSITPTTLSPPCLSYPCLSNALRIPVFNLRGPRPQKVTAGRGWLHYSCLHLRRQSTPSFHPQDTFSSSPLLSLSAKSPPSLPGSTASHSHGGGRSWDVLVSRHPKILPWFNEIIANWN